MPLHGQEPCRKWESRNSQGIALIAALVLLAMVGLVASAILQSTSTEVAISGYHQRAAAGLYVAEAGLAEAQARLWIHPGAESFYFSDPSPEYSPQWTAYLVASPHWTVQDDPMFGSQDLRYFPVAGNPANTRLRLNSVQSLLSYWVKVQHKTERDAEKDGHHRSHPHYEDGDGNFSRHRGSDKGGVLYFGYQAGSPSRPVQYTTAGKTAYLPVERVTAFSVGKGQTTRLQVDMVHDPGPPQIAAVFSQSKVILSGDQGQFIGHDACGVSLGLPPLAAGFLAQPAPTFQFGGIPPGPQVSSLPLDLPNVVSSYSRGAILVTEGQLRQVWGTSSMPVTVFAPSDGFPHSGGLRVAQVTGHGILAVEGSVRIQGAVSWVGLMIVSGTLLIDAPGSAVTIRGGVWAGKFETRTGRVNVHYDSCAIKAALLTRPLTLMNWKELY